MFTIKWTCAKHFFCPSVLYCWRVNHRSMKEWKSNIVNSLELTNDIARTYEILMQCFCYIMQFDLLDSRNFRCTKSTMHDLETSARFSSDIINHIEYKGNKHIWFENVLINIALNWVLALFIFYKIRIMVSESKYVFSQNFLDQHCLL